MRTRRDSVCNGTGVGQCASTITRFVWSGDQLLWELRAPGQSASGIDLEATTGTGDWYGRVSYFHAGGIDKPLLITKENVGSLVPRDTWRGLFHAGSSPTTGMRGDCTGATPTGCIWAPWPGWQTTASHAGTAEAPDVQAWFGGLVDGMRDASGQMYMRNRYYDPATGQFTQTDPIGLAGGLNAYGFADGDAVSYSDPYGLCAATQVDSEGKCPGGLSHAQYYDKQDRVWGGLTGKIWVRLDFFSDETDQVAFRGCASTIQHTETEGDFVGVWTVAKSNGLWTRRVVPRGGIGDLHMELQRHYAGTVRSHFGVTRARGWVSCTTGQTHLSSVFTMDDLTKF